MFTRERKKLFFKYFKNYFIPLFLLLAFLAFMTFFLVYDRFSNHDKMYKKTVESGISNICSALSDSCTNIFSITSSNPQLAEFVNTDLGDDDYDIYNNVSPISLQLGNMHLNNKYISGIYIYSFVNASLLSDTFFVRGDSTEKYQSVISEFYKAENNEYWTKVINSTNGNPKICLFKTLNDFNGPVGIIVILIDIINLKYDINTIIGETNTSFALIDNQTSEILMTTNDFDTETYSNYISKGIALPQDLYIENKIYNQNWNGIISYTDYKPLGNIYMILLLIILSFICLLILTAVISYHSAKTIYMPINEIINILDTPENIAYMNFPKELMEYSEIKYIINTINRQKQSITDLAQRIKSFSDAKKATLQAQINPHFIANTLELINLEAYALTGEENNVTEMICGLSDIMRITFRSGTRLIPISEELLITKQYIKIQSMRYEKLFNVIWEISPNVNMYYISQLILQPLVENAINHGIIPKKQPCTLSIFAYEDGDNICFEITDDGVGISDAKLRDINLLLSEFIEPSPKNIGLQNVNLRIKVIFGNEYGVKLFSKNGKTTSKITIPKASGEN